MTTTIRADIPPGKLNVLLCVLALRFRRGEGPRASDVARALGRAPAAGEVLNDLAWLRAKGLLGWEDGGSGRLKPLCRLEIV